jgi:heme/copper-type cytochrome/quinol oxidase subunit 2
MFFFIEKNKITEYIYIYINNMEVNTTSTIDPVNMYDYVNNFFLNPVVFFIIFLVVILYLIIFFSLGNKQETNINSDSSGSNNKFGLGILGIIVIALLIILVAINAFQYFFNINITASLNNLFTNKPEVNIVVEQDNIQQTPPVPEIKFRKQVFNIPGNYYSYNDAKTLCTAYNAELATYQQIENAYKNGAEWCNYGWSDGQMALFPTQQQTFNNLQTIQGHEHDCGRPGINGGFIANPNVKFGVNCYGNKPKITQDEEELMKTSSPYPKTMQDIVFQKKVDYWKTKVSEILVSPFNYKMWSEL